MFQDIDPITLITAAATFGLVLAAWAFVVTFFWSRKEKEHAEVRERLDPEAHQSTTARELRLWHEGGEATTTVYDEFERPNLRARLAATLKAANIDTSPAVAVM